MADVSQIKLPNGTIYDLIDEKSGYITAQYIENKTDYEIPVSRVGEIVVGETAIGTDSTNFPTSKAVVDYVDERIDQEIDAIDTGIIEIKANGISLPIISGVTDIPGFDMKTGQAGLFTREVMINFGEYVNDKIPTSTSQLTNDSGFITVSEIPTPDLSSYMQKGVDYVTAGQKSGTTLGNYATAEGRNTTASGNNAHAEGYGTTASGNYAHVEGRDTVVSGGGSHSEGYGSQATGNYSHAENYYTHADGYASHVEGGNSIALGQYTHAEGSATLASGKYSHTEGRGVVSASLTISGSVATTLYSVNSGFQVFDTTYLDNAYLSSGGHQSKIISYISDSANYIVRINTENTLNPSASISNQSASIIFAQTFDYDHVQGLANLAYNDNTNPQHVAGKYNSPVAGAEVIGGGTSHDARANIRVLDWSGNETLAGKLTVGTGPTANMDVATKQYVDTSIPTVPTNISAFTNDSGYLTASDIASVMTYKGTKANYAALPSTGNITGDVWHLTDTGAEWAWDGSAWQELGTAIDLSGYAQLAGASFTGPVTFGDSVTADELETGDLVVTGAASFTNNIAANTINGAIVGSSPKFTDTVVNKTSQLTNDSGFLTSYTETDPVFSASAAAGITSTDISNWNAKVSDTEKWNGVTLNKSTQVGQSNIYVPYLGGTNHAQAYLVPVVADTTGVSAANRIPKYNNNGYLVSTTPSANDNSTKVATTAYVDAAIPDVSNFLTLSTLPIYNGTVV